MRPVPIPPTPQEDEAINRGIARYPDNPEWTAEDLARARPVSDHPELVGILKANGRWGRPPLPEGERKRRVTLYLDRDVLERLKQDGRGWQTRANAGLRKVLGL
ncbi:MAG: BrnA antitoxin family protein [Paracoccaceae bacterium]